MTDIKQIEGKLAIIGCGNLGKSILSGVVSSKIFGTKSITAIDKSSSNRKRITEQLDVNCTGNISEGIADAKWIILCIQPGQIEGVLESIKPVVTKDQILISTVTGVSTTDIRNWLPGAQIIRVMPNTAASMKQSMTCICPGPGMEAQAEEVANIFDTIGNTLVIEERLMQAATVLGASGTAFFLRFLRAMIQGGIQMGFHPNEAQVIAVQTAIGAATLVQDGTHPEREIDKVTTPRGCTIEGLNEMEHQGLSSAVIKGLMASYEKINTIR